YDFIIKHRPGKNNSNADALSRIPENTGEIDCFMMEVVRWEDPSNDSDDELDPEEIVALQTLDHSSGNDSEVDIILDDNLQPIQTVAYNYSPQEVRDLYMVSIKVKQIIAG